MVVLSKEFGFKCEPNTDGPRCGNREVAKMGEYKIESPRREVFRITRDQPYPCDEAKPAGQQKEKLDEGSGGWASQCDGEERCVDDDALKLIQMGVPCIRPVDWGETIQKQREAPFSSEHGVVDVLECVFSVGIDKVEYLVGRSGKKDR